MPISDYITNLLHLQDNRIRVIDICEETIDNNICTVIYVIRDLVPHMCPNCKSSLISILNYYLRSIKYLDSYGYTSIIKYKQRRFKCNECNKTFNENCFLVKKHNTISNATIMKVLEECRTKQSFKDIAKSTNISLPTAIQLFTQHASPTRNTLTEVLCFDEFKASTNAGKYAFIIGDPIGREIIDVIKTRTQDFLYEYFNKIPLEERLEVNYIITDLFEPYKSVIHNCFWKSTHIADRFHWIRISTKCFNDLRVRIMKYYQELGKKQNNKYNKYSLYASRLKRYWKIFLTNKYQLKDKNKYDIVSYNYSYRRDMSLNDIIENLVNSDTNLENGYLLLLELYDISVNCTYENIQTELKAWIGRAYDLIEDLPEFKEAITAYSNWFNEICNSFIIHPKLKKRLSNGFIEGKNNYCKVIKRTGFGYKCFDTYKARILYTNSKQLKPYNNKR